MKKPGKKNSNVVKSGILESIRYYPTFRKTYNFLKRSQWWSREQLEEYQLQQLKALIYHAYKHVPYYTKVFDKLKLNLNEIQTFKDLQKLPFLTIDIIKKNIEDIKANNYPESKFEYFTTGGSTGSPFGFYKEKGVWLAILKAYAKIPMNWANYKLFDKSVSLTGINLMWKYYRLSRTLILSTFNMTEDNLQLYIKKIMDLKPKYIVTYPSALFILANSMNEKNIEISWKIKAIMCHGETLCEWQRKLMEETFQCRVHDLYGHKEQCVFAGTCECSSIYHIYPQYGIVELIDGKERPITQEGKIGEIVATGFNTFIFPFIRYRTGDLGVFTNQKCKCGRNYPMLKKIEGRIQDFIVSKTNRLISLRSINQIVANSFQYIREWQFYQDKKGEIFLNVVKQNTTNEIVSALEKNFRKQFGDDFHLTIQFVDFIPRTKTGKLQYLIQSYL